jgi:NADH:ubiquinone oxidoreductase subunit E
MKQHIIEICMGSSCSARGNNPGLEIIRNYVKEHKADCSVLIKGALCRGLCMDGPILIINDVVHHRVHPDTIEDLLRHALE